MCVAYPGKILSIENHHARVDFTGSVVPVNISMVGRGAGVDCAVPGFGKRNRLKILKRIAVKIELIFVWEAIM